MSKVKVNCDIQAGDRFLFRGVGEINEGSVRELTVDGILYDGKLYGTAKVSGPPLLSGETEHRDWQMPYTEAHALVEQGIWKVIP